MWNRLTSWPPDTEHIPLRGMCVPTVRRTRAVRRGRRRGWIIAPRLRSYDRQRGTSWCRNQTRRMVDDMSETTPQTLINPAARDATGRFLAGNGGNGGRRRGSRNVLGQELIDALQADFRENG